MILQQPETPRLEHEFCRPTNPSYSHETLSNGTNDQPVNQSTWLSVSFYNSAGSNIGSDSIGSWDSDSSGFYMTPSSLQGQSTGSYAGIIWTYEQDSTAVAAGSFYAETE